MKSNHKHRCPGSKWSAKRKSAAGRRSGLVCCSRSLARAHKRLWRACEPIFLPWRASAGDGAAEAGFELVETSQRAARAKPSSASPIKLDQLRGNRNRLCPGKQSSAFVGSFEETNTMASE